MHTSNPNLRANSQMSYEKRSLGGHRTPSGASTRSDARDKRNGYQVGGAHVDNDGHLRVPSHSHDDGGSDIYVTSGAYRAPSEIRYN